MAWRGEYLLLVLHCPETTQVYAEKTTRNVQRQLEEIDDECLWNIGRGCDKPTAVSDQMVSKYSDPRD